jgi:hypothetical protein
VLTKCTAETTLCRIETDREVPFLWEKPPGKQGKTAGETGRKGRGNGNTAAAVHYNAARC